MFRPSLVLWAVAGGLIGFLVDRTFSVGRVEATIWFPPGAVHRAVSAPAPFPQWSDPATWAQKELSEPRLAGKLSEMASNQLPSRILTELDTNPSWIEALPQNPQTLLIRVRLPSRNDGLEVCNLVLEYLKRLPQWEKPETADLETVDQLAALGDRLRDKEKKLAEALWEQASESRRGLQADTFVGLRYYQYREEWERHRAQEHAVRRQRLDYQQIAPVFVLVSPSHWVSPATKLAPILLGAAVALLYAKKRASHKK